MIDRDTAFSLDHLNSNNRFTHAAIGVYGALMQMQAWWLSLYRLYQQYIGNINIIFTLYNTCPITLSQQPT